MAKNNVPSKSSRSRKPSVSVDASSPQETQEFLITINRVLRSRFRDYSPNVEALESLNSISDTKTLDEALGEACSAKTFEDFCLSVVRICDKRSLLTKPGLVKPRIVLANVFNNHVATVLGKPGKITEQFLKTSVRHISPELAKQLDFKRAKSEPTVFVFGNNVSRVCDLLFTIPYKDGRKEVFSIIVLMEHKSTPDRNVVEQMLTSLVATLNFVKRYPERFKTPDGKIIWPFVVLFYTGAQRWESVPNLSDLFTTSLKELDQNWIFNLRFLLISLIDKRIDVIPPIETEGSETKRESFDDALSSAEILGFFFELLRSSEIMNANPNATRDEWLNEASRTFRALKGVYDPKDEYCVQVLDDAFSFICTMCAKKNFEPPTRDELIEIMEKEEMDEMSKMFWLLSEKEREEAISEGERRGERNGERKGKREGKQDVLTKMIGFRFPKATPTFIKKALKPFEDADVSELVSIVMTTDTLDEFKKRLKTLTRAGC